MTSNGLRYALSEQRPADTFALRACIDVKPEELGGRCLRALNCEATHQFSINLCYQFDFVRGIGYANRSDGSIQSRKICDQAERSQ